MYTRNLNPEHITTGAGLQIVREKPPDATVEGVLERALLRAKLIAESNYGDLFKVGACSSWCTACSSCGRMFSRVLASASRFAK